jgi:hypothetical protein
MATVTGPLHSDQASGTIAAQLTYRRSKRGTTVTAYSRPGSVNPFAATEAQLAVQARTKEIMQTWPTLSPTQQATWDALAVPLNVARINAFQQTNFLRMSQGQALTPVWPPEAPPAAELLIYSGIDTPPDLNYWTPHFTDGGHLTIDGFNVTATPDLYSLFIDDPSGLTGEFTFDTLPNLLELQFTNTPLANTPTLHNLPLFGVLNLINCSLTTPPDLSDLPALFYVSVDDNSIADIDSLIIALAATPIQTLDGIFSANGDSARIFLTTDPYTWTLIHKDLA